MTLLSGNHLEENTFYTAVIHLYQGAACQEEVRGINIEEMLETKEEDYCFQAKAETEASEKKKTQQRKPCLYKSIPSIL